MHPNAHVAARMDYADHTPRILLDKPINLELIGPQSIYLLAIVEILLIITCDPFVSKDTKKEVD